MGSDEKFPDALSRFLQQTPTITPEVNFAGNDEAPVEQPPKIDPPPGGWDALIRQTIHLVEPNIHNAVTEAMNALAAKQTKAKVFQRSGRLMRPVIDEPANAAPAANKPRSTQTASLIDLTCGYLEILLRMHMNWCRLKKGKPVASGPGTVPRLILEARGDWPFPVLNGLIPTATLRPDGSLLNEEGYDAATGLCLVSPPAMPTINLRPTREDAKAALALLNGLLDEFPFSDNASRSVALSEIISLVARGLDLVPLHMIKAPTAGTGKSYLNDCASYIVLGQLCPVIAATSDHEELEKRIGSAMISAHPIIALDNLNGVLNSNLLCQAVTQPIVIYRPLGKSLDIRIKCQASTILATGNNIRVCDDLGRRTLLAQMDAGIERPWTRTFKRSPVTEIAQGRGRYIAAALTIPLAYLAAGAPDQSAAPINGFDARSRLVRSPLIWLGCADPALTFDVARDDDPKVQAKIELFVAWIDFIGLGETNGRTCAQLIDASIAPRRTYSVPPISNGKPSEQL